MRIGIVGHEAAKFTEASRLAARDVIREVMSRHWNVPGGTPTLVSGGCHLGGVDVWAEEIAAAFGAPTVIHLPDHRRWAPSGYKARNEKIAADSDEVHVIVVDQLPPGFSGMRHKLCYHCKTHGHVKSGACWTARYAISLGKKAVWHVVRNLY